MDFCRLAASLCRMA
ncbi:hypothetical protein [Actinomadura graeca]